MGQDVSQTLSPRYYICFMYVQGARAKWTVIEVVKRSPITGNVWPFDNNETDVNARVSLSSMNVLM